MVKKFIPWIIIAAMAIVIAILLFKCNGGCPEGTTTSDTIIVPGDPYPVHDTLEKPVPYQVIVPSDTFWKDVDTATIFQKCKQLYKDYYTKNIYNDTLRNDTSMLIVVIDTVFQNQLQKRTMLFQNRRPTVINTTINNYGETPCNKLYIGAGLGKSIPNFLTDSVIRMPVALLLTTKGRWAYELEYDIFTNYVEAKVFYKLSFRRKK